MSRYSEWWANRIGGAAAATTSSVSPRPDYGVALDAGLAPLSPQQYEAFINWLQTQSDEQEERVRSIELEQELAENPPEEKPRGGFLQTVGRMLGVLSETSVAPGAEQAAEAVETGAEAVGTVAGGAGKVVEGLRGAARAQDELVFGEETAERMEQTREQARAAVGQGLRVATETVDDALATPAHAQSIVNDEGWQSLFRGSTWADAWERANQSTAGQAWTELGFVATGRLDADELDSFYEAGFNEYGQPNDAAFAELRQSDVAYNMISGSLDFMKAWFADPLVIGGKGVSFARALQRGDLTVMGRRNAARVRQVVTANDEQLASLNIPAWDIAGRQAVRLRSKMHELRDQVRRGEKDVVDLVNSEFAFADSPDAASMFIDAARLKKRDPETFEVLDEYDDDTFNMAVGAWLGNHAAIERLKSDALTRPISDAIQALQNKTIPSLDDAVLRSENVFEDILTDPNLTGFQRYQRAFDAERSLREAMDQADLAREQLREYESYERFLGSLASRTESPARATPGGGLGFGQVVRDATSHVLRPTGAADVAEVYTKYPRAALRRRPGVVDLSRQDSLYQSAERYFDSMVAYGGRRAMGDPAAFEAFKRDFLNRAARATTDVERRRLAGRLEDYGVAAVARKHGFTPDEARLIAAHRRRHRARVLDDVMRKHAENRAYETGGPITVSQKEGSVVETTELPLSLTELPNYFMATDLRALDGLLARHGEAIKNEFRALGSLREARAGVTNLAFEALDKYNRFWKPSVLFRLGYPIRTVTDEALRIMALTGSVTHAVGQLPQAAIVGLANMVPRTLNVALAPFRSAAMQRWRVRNLDVGSIVKGDSAWSAMDATRKQAIEMRTEGVQRYIQDRLGALHRGGKMPNPPKIVSRLSKVIESSPERFAFDVAANKKLNPKTEVVDLGLERAETVTELTPEGLAEFAYRNADRLSHPDGVLLVSKVDDGYRVSIGRKGPGYRKFKTIRQPALTRGVTAGGQQFGAPAEPGEADIYEALMSSGGYHRSLFDSYDKNTSLLRGQAWNAPRSVVGDPNHADVWAKAINDKILPDPVYRRLLENGADETVKWLKTTPEGREIRRRIPFRAANPEIWTDVLQKHLDTLLPDDVLRAKVQAGERVTPEELQLRIDRNAAAPAAIDSASLDWDRGVGPLAQAWNKFVEKGYHVLGTLPTDTLIRQPFFRTQYKSYLQRVTDTMEDGAEISAAARQHMERQAREFALRQTRRYLFSLADDTDLTHTMRFFMPFMGAWQETMTRWLTIVMERPEAVSRLWINGWQDMDELFFLEMVDENGLTAEDPNHGDLNYIRMPWLSDGMKFFDKFLPGDQSAAAEVFRNARIDKNNLNTVLQGAPWWLPGGGPLVQFPAKALFGDRPELADENAFTAFMYKYLFPTGVPDNVDAILPAGWMQQAYRLARGEDDPVFQSMVANVYKMDIANWEAEGKVGPRPTEREAIEKAEAAQVFLIAGRMVSPASFTMEVGDPDNPMSGQFFIDAANRIQAEEGSTRDAALRFLAEYGDDAWLWWTSNSKSHTGIPATSDAVKQQKKYESLIEDFPELGLLIVGMDTQKGPFNYEAYQWQRNRGERENISAEESVARAEAEEGWRRWHLFTTQLDTELASRGLTNIQQAGAEDLLITKQFYESQLYRELPGWEASRTEIDTNRSYGIINSLEEAIATGGTPDPRLRPDWRGVHEYLELHRMVGAELDARALQGGSRNIEAEENSDLRFFWDTAVGELVLSNPMFADVYHRFLENHSLTRGSG